MKSDKKKDKIHNNERQEQIFIQSIITTLSNLSCNSLSWSAFIFIRKWIQQFSMNSSYDTKWKSRFLKMSLNVRFSRETVILSSLSETGLQTTKCKPAWKLRCLTNFCLILSASVISLEQKQKAEQMLKWFIFTILAGFLCNYLPYNSYIIDHSKSFGYFIPVKCLHQNDCTCPSRLITLWPCVICHSHWYPNVMFSCVYHHTKFETNWLTS